MLALIQRVTTGSVSINDKLYSEINHGYVILLGVFEDDTELDVGKLAEKIATIRIIADEQGKMNRSILETKGEVLVVSQFTLCADITGGRRPSFLKAKKPEEAQHLYKLLIHKLTSRGIPVKTGHFGTYMNVHIHNDGPVTIIVDSKIL